MKGIISLDIDGTLVVQHGELTTEIAQALIDLYDTGFYLLFATGRTSVWALKYLEAFPRPFYLAAYNGALLYSMPEKKLLREGTLTVADVEQISHWVDAHGALVYEAFPSQRVFATMDRFDPIIAGPIEKRRERQKEIFENISSVTHLPPLSSFASVRMFVTPVERAFVLGEEIQKASSLASPSMKDSLHSHIGIIQITSPSATKGQALRFLMDTHALPAIAAGDDRNDFDMLCAATVSIAMNEAPDEVKAIATFVAPPYEPNCLLPLLHQAVSLI